MEMSEKEQVSFAVSNLDLAEMVRDAYGILEFFLGVPLSMGDKMVIRNLVFGAHEANKGVTKYYSLVSPSYEAVARYLSDFLGVEDPDGFANTVRGRQSQDVLNQVREAIRPYL